MTFNVVISSQDSHQSMLYDLWSLLFLIFAIQCFYLCTLMFLICYFFHLKKFLIVKNGQFVAVFNFFVQFAFMTFISVEICIWFWLFTWVLVRFWNLKLFSWHFIWTLTIFVCKKWNLNYFYPRQGWRLHLQNQSQQMKMQIMK